MRIGAKHQKAKYNKVFRRTGNIPTTVKLSDFQERIVSLSGKYGDGLSIIEECGVPKMIYAESSSKTQCVTNTE